MPSHLTVIKIYDSEWAWLSWRAASESLKAEGALLQRHEGPQRQTPAATTVV